ncbi:MAG: enoyl-CoA hydratase/isomerase family protein [Deltaproteobacteria bacterium]|nr:enoyl-CoA hydratase/isomerase family protein [Deltaproteobacteria bacterium]
MQKLIIHLKNGCISTLIINRPEKANALNTELLMKLGDTIHALKERERYTVLVLRGAGEKSFSSGGDLEEARSDRDFQDFIKALVYFQNSLLEYPFPVMAMINGRAIGLGVDMAAMCDIRLAADTASFVINAVKLGRVYHHTAALRLINLVGFGVATEMLLSGKEIDARQAVEYGLVNQVYPLSLLEERTYALAQGIGTGCHPQAVKNTKIMLQKLAQARHRGMTQKLEWELEALTSVHG